MAGPFAVRGLRRGGQLPIGGQVDDFVSDLTQVVRQRSAIGNHRDLCSSSLVLRGDIKKGAIAGGNYEFAHVYIVEVVIQIANEGTFGSVNSVFKDLSSPGKAIGGKHN